MQVPRRELGPEETPSRVPDAPTWRHYLGGRRKSRWPWWVTAAFCTVAIAWAIKRFLFPVTDPPRLLTAAVSVTDIEQTVLATGIIQPHKLVSVGAQASGRIVAMHVALGDNVKKD